MSTRKNLLLLCWILALLFVPVCAEFQVWHSDYFEKKLSERSALDIFAEWRWGDGGTTLYHQYVQVHYNQQIRGPLWIAPGYRQNYIRRVRGIDRWHTVYEPMLDFWLINPLGDWKVIQRFRLQWVIRREDRGRTVYRHFIAVTTPFKLPCKMRLWFSEEVFWRLDKGATQNRVRIGLKRDLAEGFHFRIYYMLRTLRAGRNQDVLGTHFSFNF